MFFQYFREVAAQDSTILRVEHYNAQPLIDARLEDGSAKFSEVTFRDWWDISVADDTKATVTTSAPEGSFYAEIADPKEDGKTIVLICSLETGEPEDAEAVKSDVTPVETGSYTPDEPEQAPEGVEAPTEPTTPAEGTDTASEAVDAPAEAPSADAAATV